MFRHHIEQLDSLGFSNQGSGDVWCFAVSPVEGVFATFTSSGFSGHELRIHDLKTATVTVAFASSNTRLVKLFFSAGGSYLVGVSSEAKAMVWRVNYNAGNPVISNSAAGSRIAQSLRVNTRVRITQILGWVSATRVALSVDERTLAVVTSTVKTRSNNTTSAPGRVGYYPVIQTSMLMTYDVTRASQSAAAAAWPVFCTDPDALFGPSTACHYHCMSFNHCGSAIAVCTEVGPILVSTSAAGGNARDIHLPTSTLESWRSKFRHTPNDVPPVWSEDDCSLLLCLGDVVLVADAASCRFVRSVRASHVSPINHIQLFPSSFSSTCFRDEDEHSRGDVEIDTVVSASENDFIVWNFDRKKKELWQSKPCYKIGGIGGTQTVVGQVAAGLIVYRHGHRADGQWLVTEL